MKVQNPRRNLYAGTGCTMQCQWTRQYAECYCSETRKNKGLEPFFIDASVYRATLSLRACFSARANLCACGAEEREGLADVISIHDHLTNQILLSRSGKHTSHARVTRYIYVVYIECWPCIYKVWLERADQEPTLLSSARKHGLTRLGYMSLKPEQLSAIDAILRGRDTFVSVPTGFGKSLVYQVLPFCADWLTGRYRDKIEQTRSDGCVASPVAICTTNAWTSRACVRFKHEY